jgi:hypothetical protein
MKAVRRSGFSLSEDLAAVVVGLGIVLLALAVTWQARPASDAGSRDLHPKGWPTPLAATVGMPGAWADAPLAAFRDKRGDSAARPIMPGMGWIVAIAAGTFFLYAYQLGGEGLLTAGNIGPLIAIVVLGACLGFLPHNIHPAKIFMGDGGALLLGLLMAASTMVVGGRTDRSFSGNSFFFFAPLLIPLVILGVPVIDTLFAIIRRARHRSGISTADKGHLHHRLMDLGHGHRRSVFILWTWTALLSGFVLWPIYSRSGDGLVPFGIAAILLSLYTVLRPGLRTGRRGS